MMAPVVPSLGAAWALRWTYMFFIVAAKMRSKQEFLGRVTLSSTSRTYRGPKYPPPPPFVKFCWI